MKKSGFSQEPGRCGRRDNNQPSPQQFPFHRRVNEARNHSTLVKNLKPVLASKAMRFPFYLDSSLEMEDTVPSCSVGYQLSDQPRSTYCSKLLTAALLTAANRWKQPKCPNDGHTKSRPPTQQNVAGPQERMKYWHAVQLGGTLRTCCSGRQARCRKTNTVRVPWHEGHRAVRSAGTGSSCWAGGPGRDSLCPRQCSSSGG